MPGTVVSNKNEWNPIPSFKFIIRIYLTQIFILSTCKLNKNKQLMAHDPRELQEIKNEVRSTFWGKKVDGMY